MSGVTKYRVSGVASTDSREVLCTNSIDALALARSRSQAF
jgi:hypothetical protein